MRTAIENARLFTMFVLLSLAGLNTSAQAQEWWASLAGQSNELIEVTVSTEQVPSGRVLDYVTFIVKFNDANNGYLGGRRYSFLDSRLPSLVPGQVYKRQFVHNIAGAFEVIGMDLSFDARSAGEKGDIMGNSARKTPPPTATKSITGPGTNKATKNDRCRRYASEAHAQNQQNLARHCGFGGSRWDSGFDNHYNWCLTVSDADANGESNTRAQMLNSCHSQ
jgi:hypothetical protein